MTGARQALICISSGAVQGSGTRGRARRAADAGTFFLARRGICGRYLRAAGKSELCSVSSNTYCIDRNRVFTTGHSYGGFFTNILGCYRGDVLRATAPVAGMPPSAYGRGTVTCSGKVAALIIHGNNDPTVDYTRGGIGGRDFWTAQNGCSTSDPVEIAPPGCLEYQNCQPDLPVVFCTHTEQHNWPSANGTGCSDGGACFDAASVIWTFFSRFQ